jgi:hypothetical protein
VDVGLGELEDRLAELVEVDGSPLMKAPSGALTTPAHHERGDPSGSERGGH